MPVVNGKIKISTLELTTEFQQVDFGTNADPQRNPAGSNSLAYQQLCAADLMKSAHRRRRKMTPSADSLKADDVGGKPQRVELTAVSMPREHQLRLFLRDNRIMG